MELVHQVGYSLPHSRLCAAHLPTLASVGCLGSAPEGVVAELAAFGFGKVREKGANAGVERHYAITAWGLDVALRRVRHTSQYRPRSCTSRHSFCPAGMTSAIRNGPRMV